MKILIYQDYAESNHILWQQIAKARPNASVAYCDADDIAGGILDSSIDLLVMPGGADLYYVEKLSPKGNQLIRDYVENGGFYLGICAGSYYGCDTIEWAQDKAEHKICDKRELGFFKGKAVGPIYPFLQDSDFDKSWNNVVPLLWNGQAPAKQDTIFYAGGPVFIPDDDADYTALAYYEDLPEGHNLAIISCAVGKGRAILSSPHPEYTAESFVKKLYRHQNKAYERDAALLKQLQSQKTHWLSLILSHGLEV